MKEKTVCTIFSLYNIKKVHPHACEVMSNGKDDEHASVPDGVGDDEGGEQRGTEAVEQAPDAAGYEGGHDEHEVHGPHMDQRIDGGSEHEGSVDAYMGGEGALHVAPPEEFLGRTDDEQQQQRNDGGGQTVLHGVDGIDLRTGEGEPQSGQLVAHPEDAPHQCGQRHAQQQLAEECAQGIAPKERPHPRTDLGAEEEGHRSQAHTCHGHGDPEVRDACRPRAEHPEPQQGCHGKSHEQRRTKSGKRR